MTILQVFSVVMSLAWLFAPVKRVILTSVMLVDCAQAMRNAGLALSTACSRTMLPCIDAPSVRSVPVATTGRSMPCCMEVQVIWSA